ncbi:hypothetical protein KCU88_g303, partial [Aureobasidium melanogenum]
LPSPKLTTPSRVYAKAFQPSGSSCVSEPPGRIVTSSNQTGVYARSLSDSTPRLRPEMTLTVTLPSSVCATGISSPRRSRYRGSQFFRGSGHQ